MRMQYCKKCGVYTLKGTCNKCDGRTASPRPARFSALDPYGKYRRTLKTQKAG